MMSCILFLCHASFSFRSSRVPIVPFVSPRAQCLAEGQCTLDFRQSCPGSERACCSGTGTGTGTGNQRAQTHSAINWKVLIGKHQTGDEATKTGKTFKEGAGGKVASVCTLSGRGSPRAAKRPSITFCTQTRRRTPHGKGIQKLRERRGGECGMPLPPPLALFTRSRYAEEATWEKQGSFTRSGASRS